MSNVIDEMLMAAGLNRSQRKFCKEQDKKNLRLLAPAGCGKTYSILWRCRCILENRKREGKPEPNFLVVTFTHSAMLELSQRVENTSEFSDLREHITISTLNSWGWRRFHESDRELAKNRAARTALITHDLRPLCSAYPNIDKALCAPRTKIANAATIIDLIDLLKAMGFTHTMKKRDIAAHRKYLKGIGLSYILEDGWRTLFKAEGIADDAKTQKASIDEFFEFWKKAVPALASVRRYTMEDQKYWPRVRIENAIEEQRYPQGISKFSHIIVDEFQDINPLDLELIRAIAIAHGHGKSIPITIVGDDDQAIFGWRGTTPEYILNPEKYLGVKFDTCLLDTNYRSPKDIVILSSNFIAHNKKRVPKEMKSAAKGRAYIKLVSKKNESARMDAVMSIIRKVQNNPNETVAIIGRKQTTLFPYQVLLSNERIPYVIDVDIDIFAGEAMSSLISIVRAIIHARNHDNDDTTEDFLTVCDKVRKFSITKKDRIWLSGYLNGKNISSFEEAIRELRCCPDESCSYAGELASAVEKLMRTETVYDFMKTATVVLQGLGKSYQKRDTDNHYKEPQFERIATIARKYGSDFVAFTRDIETARKTSEENRNIEVDLSRSRIHIITATRSKGHEYDHVIIADTGRDEWSAENDDELEEERRLFYVAMTRAKHYLYFMKIEDVISSRFLLEAGIEK